MTVLIHAVASHDIKIIRFYVVGRYIYTKFAA